VENVAREDQSVRAQGGGNERLKSRRLRLNSRDAGDRYWRTAAVAGRNGTMVLVDAAQRTIDREKRRCLAKDCQQHQNAEHTATVQGRASYMSRITSRRKKRDLSSTLDGQEEKP
jgi:hypothetical protein